MSDRVLILDCETRGLVPELGQTAFAVATAWMQDWKWDGRVSTYRVDNADDMVLLRERMGEADLILGHNIKFDARQLIRTLGLPHNYFGERLRDTWIWARHLSPQSRFKGGFGLKVLTKDASGLPEYADPKKWLRKHVPKEQRHDYSLLPDEILVPYLTADIVRTAGLARVLGPLSESCIDGTKRMIELDQTLLPYILQMELAGVRISAEELDTVEKALAIQLVEVKKLFPPEFDFQSRTDLIATFGYHLRKFGFLTMKRAPRADKEALKFLQARDVPLAEQVLKAREYSKLLSTYLKKWQQYLPIGRVHGAFHLVGTDTGRFSSSDPNLQNIPKLLRRVLTPDPGFSFVSGDYKQMEYRAAAMLSKDAKAIQATETDIHVESAKLIFDISHPDKMARNMAKTVNFALVYGAGVEKVRRGLSQAGTKVWTQAEAREAVEKVRRQFTGISVWSSTIMRSANDGRAVTDPLGRKQIPDRFRPYSLTNHVVQGFCAGLVKYALLNAFRAGLDVRLTVHDSIIVQCPTSKTMETVAKLRECMEQVAGYTFPVELSICDSNWFDEVKVLEDR